MYRSSAKMVIHQVACDERSTFPLYSGPFDLFFVRTEPSIMYFKIITYLYFMLKNVIFYGSRGNRSYFSYIRTDVQSIMNVSVAERTDSAK